MNSLLFAANHDYINAHPDRFLIEPGACRFAREYVLTPSREELPGVEVREGDRTITLVSPYYPLREAQKLAESVAGSPPTILLFGLGWHFPATAKLHPAADVVIIEPDKHLFNLILNHIDLRTVPENTRFIIGFEEYAVARLIGNLPTDYAILDFKARTKLQHAYFANLARRLAGQPAFESSDAWKYPKFAGLSVRVLFIDSGYVLTKECLWGLDRAGASFRYIHIDRDNYDYDAFIRNFLKEIAEFRPDFVLTVNHLGFDQEGRLTELLSTLEIPYVSWYVDSPTVVLSGGGTNISPWCSLFVWDRDYIDDVKRCGYPHVDYLPLAAMPDLFRPMNLPELHPVAFVGSSMVYSTHKNLRRMVFRQDLLSRLDDVAREFLQIDSRYVADAMNRLEQRGITLSFDSREQRDDFEAAVLWRSTQIYRMSGLQKLADFHPTVFGDPNWDEVLDNRFRIEREVLYYDGLAELYNQCRISFNMTSRQMKNAVNQRVFDVPSCGRFLLTDHKSQLDEIFEPGELVSFREVGEIPDLVRFYLDHDAERQKIANLGRERILKKDTYVHRIREMIAIMRFRYGKGR
jgi:spore maturation protein CgeB